MFVYKVEYHTYTEHCIYGGNVINNEPNNVHVLRKQTFVRNYYISIRFVSKNRTKRHPQNTRNFNQIVQF